MSFCGRNARFSCTLILAHATADRSSATYRQNCCTSKIGVVLNSGTAQAKILTSSDLFYCQVLGQSSTQNCLKLLSLTFVSRSRSCFCQKGPHVQTCWGTFRQLSCQGSLRSLKPELLGYCSLAAEDHLKLFK